VQPKHKAVAA